MCRAHLVFSERPYICRHTLRPLSRRHAARAHTIQWICEDIHAWSHTHGYELIQAVKHTVQGTTLWAVWVLSLCSLFTTRRSLSPSARRSQWKWGNGIIPGQMSVIFRGGCQGGVCRGLQTVLCESGDYTEIMLNTNLDTFHMYLPAYKCVNCMSDTHNTVLLFFFCSSLFGRGDRTDTTLVGYGFIWEIVTPKLFAPVNRHAAPLFPQMMNLGIMLLWESVAISINQIRN